MPILREIVIRRCLGIFLTGICSTVGAWLPAVSPPLKAGAAVRVSVPSPTGKLHCAKRSVDRAFPAVGVCPGFLLSLSRRIRWNIERRRPIR